MVRTKSLAVLVVALCVLMPGAGAASGKPGKASGQSPVQAALAAPCKLVDCAALSKGMENGIKAAKAALDKLAKDVKRLVDTAVAFLVKLKDDITGETARKEKAEQERREAAARAVSDERKPFLPGRATPFAPPRTELSERMLHLSMSISCRCTQGPPSHDLLGICRGLLPPQFSKEAHAPFDQRKVASGWPGMLTTGNRRPRPRPSAGLRRLPRPRWPPPLRNMLVTLHMPPHSPAAPHCSLHDSPVFAVLRFPMT